jgi:hypothetical protein
MNNSTTAAGSVLEAIKLGLWNFEPEDRTAASYDCTSALPGTKEKLDVLAERVRQGLPLWHSSDRRYFLDREVEE